MKTIIFVGTQKSGSSREAIKVAEKMGYFTVLLTDKSSQLNQRNEYPDVHQMILCDLNDFDMLKRIINQLTIRKFNIKAIVSFVDPHCLTASKLASEFGVNRFSLEAVNTMQNKISSREALKDTPYAPKFITIKANGSFSKDRIINMIPIIMKSPQSTGSKDVYLIKDYDDFSKKMVHLIRKYPFSTILIEEFLDGPQYLVEAMVINGEVHIVAVIDQEISYCNDHFIVTGYNLLLDMEPEFFDKLKEAVQDIIKGHGLENGGCHLELRYVNETWKLIEINPRISGGGMNDLIETGLGINLVKETLKLALGEDVDLTPKHKVHTFSEYVVSTMNGRLIKVTGKAQAKQSKGVKKVYIKPRKGSYLSLPVSLGNRYAYIIACGDTEEEARENAKKGAELIQFHMYRQ